MTATAPRTTRPVPVARLSDAPLPTVDPSIPPWPGEQVRLGGVDLFVRHTPGPAGGGEPALYVHGLGGASTNWTDYAALLATRLDGEALDLPGFGESGPAACPRRVRGAGAGPHGRRVPGAPRRPVRCTWSATRWAGSCTLLVAATRPDLVRTLTLISPAMPWLRPRRGSDFAMPMLLLPGIGRYAQRRLDALPPEQRAAGLIRICLRRPGGGAAQPDRRGDRRDGQAQGAALVDRRVHRVAARAGPLLPGRSGRGRCGGRPALVRAPTLVVWGAEDRLVPVELAARTAAAVPDSRLLVLPDVGHVRAVGGAGDHRQGDPCADRGRRR